MPYGHPIATPRTAPPSSPGGSEASPAPVRSRSFRPDVDGLRAVAIVLVVAYHAHLPKVGGGFVGVDVFFVISGYLITRNLLTEADSTGRIALRTFWAKRVRRLAPALGLVVLATLVASVAVLPLLRWDDVARDAAASATYVSNIVFAADTSGYFATDAPESPLLHTWSLSVEEQFYLVWPLLVLACAWLVRRRPHRLGAVLALAFGVSFVASAALSVVLTTRSPTWAFYMLPTRAWEFAAAGLLAVATLPGWTRTPVARWVASGAGLGLVLYAGTQLSATTAYPGLWPLLPVAGTLLLIAAGDPGPEGASPALPSRVLAAPPLQWLGRLSYSWYLWHWPAMVLAVAAVGEDTTRVRTAAGVATLGLAHLTYHHYENPVRFSSRLTASTRRSFLAGAALTSLVLLAAGAVVLQADRRAQGDDLQARLARAVEELPARDCVEQATTPAGTPYCVAGDPASDTTVLLVGDSHAGHWVVAFDEAARRAGVRLAWRWRGACPAVPMAVGAGVNSGEGEQAACRDHQRQVEALLTELDPDAVVLAHSNDYASRMRSSDGAPVPPAERPQVWAAALRQRVEGLRAAGIPVGLVVDNPVLAHDPNACVAREDAVEPCEPSLQESLHRTRAVRRAEVAVAEELGMPTLDVNDVLCDDRRCALEVDGQLVYADRGHLTEGFTTSRVPDVVALLDALLDADRP